MLHLNNIQSIGYRWHIYVIFADGIFMYFPTRCDLKIERKIVGVVTLIIHENSQKFHKQFESIW